MRIYNQKLTVRKILWSRLATLLYFLVFLVFIFWSFQIFPIWISMGGRMGNAVTDLQMIKDKNQKKEELNNNLKTDEGKKRYEKEFFNKLDEGEKLIILYGSVASETRVEENFRQMSWYETKKQDFLIWLYNLKF